MTLRDWLANMDLARDADAFEANEIELEDLETLVILTDEDLKASAS